MSADTGKYIKKIRQSVIIYIIGCSFFFACAIASIAFGYYLIRYYPEHELPLSWLLFSIAGVILLWEMIKAFRFKTTIPANLRIANETEYPALFQIIHEITNNLNLTPIHEVYIAPDATAAVFIQPSRKLGGKPQRNLVIGLGFLTQMDDDELRTMLYHEFGHYAQEAMKNTLSVYTIAQYSRSFLTIKEPEKAGTWNTQIKSQVLLFTYFVMWICNRINQDYKQLAKQMEYDADDVAIQYMGMGNLQRTLLHAACIQYNYTMLQWGMQILAEQSIQVDNPYAALYFIGQYNHPTKDLLPAEIICRLERVGELSDLPSSCTSTVRDTTRRQIRRTNIEESTCSAVQFAEWLRDGVAIYQEQQRLSKSVVVNIHLAPKRHKLPYAEGKYNVLLDEQKVGMGNFIKGYTIKRHIAPGKHTLSVYAPIGITMKPFEFDTHENISYHIELDYAFHFKNSEYEILVEKIEQD